MRKLRFELAAFCLAVSTLSHAAPAFDPEAQHGLATTATGVLMRWTSSELVIEGNVPKMLNLPVVKVIPRPRDKAFVWVKKPVTVSGGTVREDAVYLVDETGTILEEWNLHDGVVVDVIAPGRRAYVLKGDGILRLDPNQGTTVIESFESYRPTLLADNARKLIVCNARDQREAAAEYKAPSPGCRSQAGWRFEGGWSNVQPFLCGPWLIEPMQSGTTYNTEKLRIRSLADGSVTTERAYRGEHLLCVDGKALFDVEKQMLVSLPDLTTQRHAECAGRPVVTLSQSATPTACLNDKGQLGQLRVENR